MQVFILIGYAIALMMDVLSGVLSGSGILTEVSSPFKTDKPSRCGHFFLALDIAAFGPRASFEARMEQMIAEVKAVPLAPGHDEILYPGELEARNEAQYAREGLELPEQTLSDLRAAASRLGVDW
jgi:LDH2 family malate/lactate/ureidoglycolate dehydrogenase